MRKIQMVDLQGQYQKIKPEIDEAILKVVRSTAFINGPEVKLFEQELANYLGVKHVIGCANGTDALQIALMAAGLEPGDEVITPSFTYIATAEVIALLRLKPVFVEVDPNTFVMDPNELEKALSAKTKAIVPVHLYGQCADMEKIIDFAKKHDLKVIEDTAQAIGSDFIFSDGGKRKAGTIGDIGCTSFFPSKNLGCYGDGGAIFTNDDQLDKKIRMIANHGQERRYYHDIIGVNSRLDTIQAAVLRVKLGYLNDYINERIRVADYYDNAFGGVEELIIPERAGNSTHSFHQYTLKLKGVDRDALQEFLSSKEIPSNIYYPLPAHRQQAFLNYDHRKNDLTLTEQLCQEVFSLPIHTEMDEEQLKHVTGAVLQFAAIQKEKV